MSSCGPNIFPEELWLETLDYLRDEAQLQTWKRHDRAYWNTLRALRETCRVLARLVLPYLYESQSFPRRNLRLVLPKLFRLPYILPLFKNVTLEGPYTLQKDLQPFEGHIHADGKVTSMPYPAEFSAKIESIITSMDIDPCQKEDLVQNVMQGFDTGVTLTLLHLSSNIRHLDLTDEYGKRVDALFFSVLEQHTAVFLPNLEGLTVRNWETKGDCDPHSIMPFFLAPKLKKFRGWLIRDFAPNRANGHAQFPPIICPKIEEIELNRTSLTRPGLEYLCRSCPNLKQLSITWGEDVVPPNRLDMHEFIEVLQRHAPHLTSLELEPSALWQWRPWPQYVGDMSGLTALEKFTFRRKLVGVLIPESGRNIVREHMPINLQEINLLFPHGRVDVSIARLGWTTAWDTVDELLVSAISDFPPQGEIRERVTITRTDTSGGLHRSATIHI